MPTTPPNGILPRMADLWSYSAGRWGYNRVRVYERRPGAPLQVEFTGGRRQTLAQLNGEPVYDRALAQRIADEMAHLLAQGAVSRQARDVLRLPEQHTLEELARRYHRAVGPTWSPTHKRQQEQMRDFWLAKLGRKRNLRPNPSALVEEVVDREARRNKWSPRTRQKYLRYIVALYRYGRRKLKWIDERDDLSAVDIPKARGASRPYSTAEALAILGAAPKVDLRLSVACELAWMTGRRINAIRQARSDGYRVEGQYGVVPFPAKTDKARRASEVYITGTTRQRVEMLVQRPLVQSSGLLLPDGDLDRGGRAEPVSYDWLLDRLREAEEAAGVEWVKGRGFHGFKRRFATLTAGQAGAAQQAGTDRRTLERVYEQDDPEGKQAVADALESLRSGA